MIRAIRGLSDLRPETDDLELVRIRATQCPPSSCCYSTVTAPVATQRFCCLRAYTLLIHLILQMNNDLPEISPAPPPARLNPRSAETSESEFPPRPPEQAGQAAEFTRATARSKNIVECFFCDRTMHNKVRNRPFDLDVRHLDELARTAAQIATHPGLPRDSKRSVSNLPV